jgi:hypothetical protein
MRYVLACASMVAAMSMTSGSNAAQFSSPNSNRVELFLENLICENTTEAGADEVYILLLATSSDGRQIARRLPANLPHESSGHWDMNDDRNLGCNKASGDSHCIGDKPIGTFDTTGRTWDVTVAFMEEDRGLERNMEDVVMEGAKRGGGNVYATILHIWWESPIAIRTISWGA